MKVYDNYEISPCTRTEEPESPGTYYFEVCEPEEADVWTLYGHIDGEGVEAIGDFATREHAEYTFQRIVGIPFTGSREVIARLRAMHAASKMLAALRKTVAFIDAAELTQHEDGFQVWVEARTAIEEAEGRTA
ncbi:hypothetical protein [Fimbriiglobus ruber]|uniref:Uncharacterized protein n=1 Tax=Fimbriiglobus ruber TaxID=1908690 RepID=A0A225E1B0_9BACT|nr:hypothetical protein [Fimbriiglobus ruber]OWK45574.1 hypothetical protein FRUB_01905 [Fimbriiglobus ruber]